MKATVQKTSLSANHDRHDGTAFDARQALNPAGDTLVLQGGQFAYVRDASGWYVNALSGSVWITQDGDVRDIVLQAGESFRLDRHGPALFSPLGSARVSVKLLDADCTKAHPRVVMPAHEYGHAAFA